MSHVPIPPPTQDELQEIRDADELAGEDLRFAPPAWTHRRQLLAYIDLMEEQYRKAMVLASMHLVTPTPEAVAMAPVVEAVPAKLWEQPAPPAGHPSRFAVDDGQCDGPFGKEGM